MKHIVRAAAPVLAIALLAGCSTPGDTAFVVDGERTRLSTVDDTAAGCEAIGQGQIKAEAIKGEVVRMLLAGQIAQAVASNEKFTIDGAERAKAITQLQGDELRTNAECARAVDSFADFAVVSQRLGQAQLAKAIDKVKVDVNPRYGTWDTTKMAFTSTSGSLSREAVGNGTVFGG